MFANTPKPPYYAVIFTSVLKNNHGYKEMAEAMEKLVKLQEGFLGYESARNDIGITVSYWRDLESIRQWKENEKHAIAQNQGKNIWYSDYIVRIAKVERDYEFSDGK
jgi:heme-degrading monooxygenase HmoA